MHSASANASRDGHVERGKAAWRSVVTVLIMLSAGMPAPAESRSYYVRVSGSDLNDGLTAATALRTVGRAAVLAGLGDRIVVGPGTYDEANVAPAASGGVSFVGDSNGVEVGEAPGDIVINAGERAAGLLISRKGQISISGFVVTGATAGIEIKNSAVTVEDTTVTGNGRGFVIRDSNVRVLRSRSGLNRERGVYVRGDSKVALEDTTIDGNGSDGVQAEGSMEFSVTDCLVAGNKDDGLQFITSTGVAIRNSIIHSNASAGVVVLDSPSPNVVNNLIYANGDQGMYVGGVTGGSGSPGAQLLNNTFYGNKNRGAVIGGSNAQPPSPSARVFRNIFQANTPYGLQVNQLSVPGYVGDYNMGTDEFYVTTPFGANDRFEDPLLVGPAGLDGKLGGDNASDDDFHLNQVAAGQSVTSPAVDAGGVTVSAAGVEGRSTRTDGVADSGVADIGFHYGARTTPISEYFVSTSGSDSNSGISSADPLRTVAEALRRATFGSRVWVGTGLYVETDLRPGAGVTIKGTGEGPAVMDARGGATVFDVRESNITILDLDLTGASIAAVRVRADRFAMSGCGVYSNPGDGVFLASGWDGAVFNNVIYINGGTAIVIGDSIAAASNAVVAQNTIYRNAGHGLAIGLGSLTPSLGAAVMGNIIAENVREGIAVGTDSVDGLRVSHNCNSDGHKGISAPASDIAEEPLLLNPAGPDRVLGGSGAADDDFHLQHVGAGQAATSPCVNRGGAMARRLGLRGSTTRSDNRSDGGRADAGYHYGVASPRLDSIRSAVRRFARTALPALP